MGERGQAEFGANLLQTPHQKCPLVHPLFDRAERMFDRLAPSIKDLGPHRQARLHPVQNSFVLKARDEAETVSRTLRPDLAISANLLVDVIDLLQSTQKR
jgi:hypothetical protein